MTNNKEHCIHHLSNMERIVKMETKVESHDNQVEDLYDKHNEVIKMMTSMKLCMESMNGNIKKGFEKQDLVYEQLHEAFQERTKVSNALLIKYDAIIDGFNAQFAQINIKLAELDKFDWFRKRLNQAKECLPDIVIWIFIVFMAFLVAEHWLGISTRIGKWLSR